MLPNRLKRATKSKAENIIASILYLETKAIKAERNINNIETIKTVKSFFAQESLLKEENSL